MRVRFTRFYSFKGTAYAAGAEAEVPDADGVNLIEGKAAVPVRAVVVERAVATPPPEQAVVEPKPKATRASRKKK